jgi:hypothetical protein
LGEQPKEANMLHKQRVIWLGAVAGVAALATMISITVALAMGGTSTKPTRTQPAAPTSSRIAATCAPDDSLPIGPGGEGILACLDDNGSLPQGPRRSGSNRNARRTP